MMSKSKTTEIIELIIDYRNKQKWENNDTLTNLSKSILIEATELLSNYKHTKEDFNEENVKEELADILMYSFTLCYELGLDIYHEMISRLD